MEILSFKNFESRVAINVSHFPVQEGVDEYYMTFYPLKPDKVDVQLGWLSRAYTETLMSIGIKRQTAVFRRFFCSDLVNQWNILEKMPFSSRCATDEKCAVSWICQPPGYIAKVAFWAYHICDKKGSLEKHYDKHTLCLTRGSLTHNWSFGVNCLNRKTPYEQTIGILERYNSLLQIKNMSLAGNVIRTWFFIKDIDANYQEFVNARRKFFATNGLTQKTHFIASTGVGGYHIDISAKITMDAYAISGLLPEQIKFLSAPKYLSSTYMYGVTFERGTIISYRDRKHIIISGTASINHKGRILYEGDVLQQLKRTFENIEALLANAGASLKNMAIMIAYVRDPSDYTIVWQQIKQNFPAVPLIIACSSVCRPGWLVEVEGISVIPNADTDLPSF